MEEAQKLVNLLILFFLRKYPIEESLSLYNEIISTIKGETVKLNNASSTYASEIIPYIKFVCGRFNINENEFIKEMKVLNLEEVEICDDV